MYAENYMDPHDKDYIRTLTSIIEACSNLSASLDLSSIVTHLTRESYKLSGMDGAIVGLYDPEEGLIEMIPGFNATQPLATYPELKLGDEFTALKQGITLVVGDTSATTLSAGIQEIVTKLGIKSTLAAPIIYNSSFLGFLMIYATGRVREISETTIKTIEVLVKQASMAIKNARIFEAERERASELEAVLSSIQDGIVIYREKKVVFFNEAAERIRDLPIKPGERRDEVSELINMRDATGRKLGPDEVPSARAFRGETFSDLEVFITTGSGKEKVVRISGSPTRDRTGRITGAVIVLHDISDLRSAQAKLEEALSNEHFHREELEATINSMTDAVVTVNSEGRFSALNPSAVDLLGNFFDPPVNISAEEAVEHCKPRYADTGLPVPPEDIAFVRALQERFTAFEVTFRMPSGEERAISSSGSPIYDPQGKLAGGVVVCRDITGQIKARRRSQSLLRRLSTLNEIAEVSTSSLNPEELAQNITSGLIEKFGISIASIWLADEDRRELTPIAGLGYPPGFFETIPSIPVDASFENSIVFTSGEPVFIEDISTGPVSSDTREVIERTGIRARAGVFLPLKARRETVGTINLAWPEPRTFTQEDIDFFTSIANEVAVGLENARLFQQVESDRRNLEILNKIELNITSGFDLKTLMNRTVEGIRELIETDAAGIVFWDENKHKITDVFFTGIPEYVTDTLLTTPSVTKTIIESKRPGLVENYPSYPTAVKEFVDIGLINAVIVPIISKGITRGAIHILGLSPDKKFGENDVRLLEAVARPVAIAIENANLFEAEKERAVLLEALNKVNAAISSTLDFDEIMQRVVVESAEAIGSETAAVDPREGNLWLTKYIYGFPQEIIGVALTDEEAPHATLAAKTKKPVVINNTHTDERVNREVMERFNIRSVMVVPLIVRGKVIGTLFFNYHSAPVGFTEAQVDFASKVAASVSLALENARLFEKVQLDKRNLEALNEIGLNITSDLDLKTLMNRTAENIRGLVKADAAGIVFWDEERHEVTDVFFIGIPEYVADTIISKPSVTKSIIESRKPNLVEDYPSQPTAIKEFIDIGTKNGVVVPIMSKEKILGAILAVGLSPEIKFSEDDVRLLESVAKPVAIGLENARLYEAERNIADTLQEALLTVPEKIEGIEFGYLYRSATQVTKVGGDFYDLFEVEHGKIGIVIGDVSGKGLEAATLTSLAKNTIKAYSYQESSPASIISKANDVVRRESAPGMFITLFFGILDINTGILTYCNAGHPPGILRRINGNVELLLTRSPIVGAFPRLSYVEDQAILKTGDVLVLYTDGVTEARRNSDFFGEDGLIGFVENLPASRVKEVPQGIFDRVADYTGGRLSDDIAILSIGLTGDHSIG